MKMRPRLRKPRPRAAAFTLIEVLAALLVLSIAMIAWQLRMSQNLDSASYLRDKTVASWVALNQLELLRIARRGGGAAPLAGLQGSVTMAGTTWYWALAPQASPGVVEEDVLVPVTVGVSAENAEAARSAPLVTLTGVSDAWQ
jgi:general secretion pathway protein I